MSVSPSDVESDDQPPDVHILQHEVGDLLLLWDEDEHSEWYYGAVAQSPDREGWIHRSKMTFFHDPPHHNDNDENEEAWNDVFVEDL